MGLFNDHSTNTHTYYEENTYWALIHCKNNPRERMLPHESVEKMGEIAKVWKVWVDFVISY